MRMTRFDSELAHDKSKSTFAPLSDAGNRPPRINFEVLEPCGCVMTACPPGAFIRCEYDGPDKSNVRIRTSPGGDTEKKHIANLIIYASGADDLTTETIAIASAIYWSWWRARDMNGEAP